MINIPHSENLIIHQNAKYYIKILLKTVAKTCEKVIRVEPDFNNTNLVTRVKVEFSFKVEKLYTEQKITFTVF